MNSENVEIDLSEVDTKEEINEVLEDLAEIENEIDLNVKVELSQDESLSIDNTCEEEVDKVAADSEYIKHELMEADMLEVALAKVEKLKQLIMLTDKELAHITPGRVQQLQMHEFIKEFPDEA